MDIIAWVHANCKFASQKVFYCKIYRGLEVKAEDRWADASQAAAETHFMYKHTGSALKRQQLQNAGWICKCQEITPEASPANEEVPAPQQGLLFDNAEQPFKR